MGAGHRRQQALTTIQKYVLIYMLIMQIVTIFIDGFAFGNYVRDPKRRNQSKKEKRDYFDCYAYLMVNSPTFQRIFVLDGLFRAQGYKRDIWDIRDIRDSGRPVDKGLVLIFLIIFLHVAFAIPIFTTHILPGGFYYFWVAFIWIIVRFLVTVFVIAWLWVWHHSDEEIGWPISGDMAASWLSIPWVIMKIVIDETIPDFMRCGCVARLLDAVFCPTELHEDDIEDGEDDIKVDDEDGENHMLIGDKVKEHFYPYLTSITRSCFCWGFAMLAIASIYNIKNHQDYMSNVRRVFASDSWINVGTVTWQQIIILANFFGF